MEYNKAELQEFKRVLHEDIYSYQWTDEAFDAVDAILQSLIDEDYDADTDFYEIMYYQLDYVFMYYNDAFDYLKANQIYEFSDAVAEGFGTNVSTVAYYYLEQEVYELLREIGFDW